MTFLKTAAFSAFILFDIFAAQSAAAWDDCDVERPMQELVAANGIKRVKIDARAGSLEIAGGSSRQLVVDGTACGTNASLLAEIDWRVERRGDVLEIETLIPQTDDNEYGRLDLSISLPRELDIEIIDSSGAIDVRDAGAVRIRDSSGSVQVQDSRGPLILKDGSGSINVSNIRNEVEIDDGSGSMYIERIKGDVTLSDSSGSISVSDVKGSVLVRRDGSGSIRVQDIEGDFRVARDGSGGISHTRVAGTVEIPETRRRHRH